MSEQQSKVLGQTSQKKEKENNNNNFLHNLFSMNQHINNTRFTNRDKFRNYKNMYMTVKGLLMISLLTWLQQFILIITSIVP